MLRSVLNALAWATFLLLVMFVFTRMAADSNAAVASTKVVASDSLEQGIAVKFADKDEGYVLVLDPKSPTGVSQCDLRKADGRFRADGRRPWSKLVGRS